MPLFDRPRRHVMAAERLHSESTIVAVLAREQDGHGARMDLPAR
jgi:hypothetical protein